MYNMYFIYLLFVFLISSYVYHTYLPNVIDWNESLFIICMCGLFSFLYLAFIALLTDARV